LKCQLSNLRPIHLINPVDKPNYLVNPESLEERGGVGMPNRPIFCSNVSKNISVAFNISPLLPIYDFFYGHTNEYVQFCEQ